MTQPIMKQRDDLPSITAGDLCTLTELLHPARDAGANVRYSLAYAFVEAGGRTLDHYLEQSEVYYIIRGNGTMFLNDEAYAVTEGSTYYIPPKCNQWLRNDSDERIEFLVIVDPPWTEDEETIVEDAET